MPSVRETNGRASDDVYSADDDAPDASPAASPRGIQKGVAPVVAFEVKNHASHVALEAMRVNFMSKRPKASEVFDQSVTDKYFAWICGQLEELCFTTFPDSVAGDVPAVFAQP